MPLGLEIGTTVQKELSQSESPLVTSDVERVSLSSTALTNSFSTLAMLLGRFRLQWRPREHTRTTTYAIELLSQTARTRFLAMDSLSWMVAGLHGGYHDGWGDGRDVGAVCRSATVLLRPSVQVPVATLPMLAGHHDGILRRCGDEIG